VRSPLLLIGIGVLLFSTGPVAVASSSTTGAVLSFWRLWIGTVVMGAAALVQVRTSRRRPTRTGWILAVRCGVVFGIHQLFFMIAIKATSVVDVTLMQVLQPVFVGALAVVAFGERPGMGFRLWSLVAIAGAAMVALAGASGPDGDPLGVGLAALNVLFYAVYFVWSKQARDHIDTAPFLFGVIVAAGAVVSLYCLGSGAPLRSVERGDLGVALFLALVPGGLGHFVTTWPLRRVAANVPPVMQLAVPFFAGALAWALLDQPVTWLHVVGGIVTVGGVLGSLLSPSGRRLIAPTGPDPTFVPGD
jgi:drug/metabolite transporter (DMT)-like permease